MYPSSFFRFKKLIEHPEIQNNSNNSNHQIGQENNDYDNSSITNNVEEFKSLFRTQEKLCYELRSENAVLKTKLEIATELNKIQYKKIKKLKFENGLYEKICYNSGNYNYNNNNEPNKKYIKNEDEIKQQSFQTHPPYAHTYPPPPPLPLPLPPPINTHVQLIQNKKKMDGNPLMNSVLDELKSRMIKTEE